MTSQDEAAKLADIERREGWKLIMSTPASRRVMWEQFEVMGIYQNAPSLEHGTLAYTEGRRSLGLQIMNGILANCPELYDRMVAENRERLLREKTEEQERDQ